MGMAFLGNVLKTHQGAKIAFILPQQRQYETQHNAKSHLFSLHLSIVEDRWF